MSLVKELFKIFDPRTERAIPLLEEGCSKEENLDRTGLTVAVNNGSFTVRKVEFFLSGSGRSTLLRCLTRLIKPTRGQILIAGETPGHKLRKIGEKTIGMVF